VVDKEVKWDYDVTVLGEPASAKNQRRIVKVRGKPLIIKSQKALDYARSFASQLSPINPLIAGDVAISLDVYYASRRPDLAAMDLVMDLLQGIVYLNDRQVKASRSLWNLDKENPRVRVRVRQIQEDCSTGTSSFPPSKIWGVEE
jgi:Holliday junction resolvase RusA-like endonuclease